MQKLAFGLKAGDVAPPVQVSGAGVIVQRVAHDQPDMAEFAKKKDELRETAERQAEVQLMQSLRKALLAQAVIERNGAILAPAKPQS